MLRLRIFTVLASCLPLGGCDSDNEEVTATASESATDGTGDTAEGTSVGTESDGPTTADEGSTTADESSTTLDESSTGGAELECGWRVGSIKVEIPPGGNGTFPVALATCDESGVRLRVLSEGSASCENPNSTPGCDDAYEGVTLTLAPEQLQAGTYDLDEVSNWVDLQGGGGGKVDCGYVGSSADGGELIISSVTETAISGYITAQMNNGPDFSEFVAGRFTASLCPESGS